MRASPVPAAELEVAQRELVLRFGSERGATVRTLYAWLNLTLLLVFAWPLLVVFFDAPSVTPADTPGDWFALRLAAPVLVTAIALRIWWASGAPRHVAVRAGLRDLAASGQLWIQVTAFLAILTVVLAVVLLLSDPTAAAKVLLLGLFEALAIQLIVPGYVKTTFEALEADPGRAFWICVALLALTFALRGTMVAAVEPDVAPEVVAGAAIALGLAGVLLGAAFVYLRDRTGSLLPGFLLAWLVLAIVPAVAG